MAIGFVTEMLAEGVIFEWIKRAWRAISGGAKHEIVKGFIEKNLVPKGLDDENIFTYIFSISKFKNGDKSKGNFGTEKQWQLLSGTLVKMDNEDYTNKTHYVKNFRLIVAMDAIGRGYVKTSIGDKDKETKVIEKPDPNYIRPGVSILQDIVSSCKDENEIRAYIIMAGAMQDAPFGTLDEMKHWAKTVGLPFLHQVLVKTGQGIRDASVLIESHYRGLDDNWDGAKAMSWRNPIAKIIALFRAM